METVPMGLKIVILITAAAVYLLAMRALQRHSRSHEEKQEDDAYLSLAALGEGASEYDLFLRAAGSWGVSEKQAEKDFTAYLNCHRMPHYVRDFIRKHRACGKSAGPHHP